MFFNKIIYCMCLCIIYSLAYETIKVFFSDHEFTAAVHTWIYLDQVIFVTNWIWLCLSKIKICIILQTFTPKGVLQLELLENMALFF